MLLLAFLVQAHLLLGEGLLPKAAGAFPASNRSSAAHSGGMSVTVTVLVNYNGEDVTCVGACNGVVIAAPTGGTPPYTYLWEDGQTNQVAIGLCAGTINVTVTDATGTESAVGGITLNDPIPLVVTAVPFAFAGGYNISCFGLSDGQITASSVGGVGGYSYFWSDGQLGPSALSVPAGSIFVQVTDANGCTDLDTVIMQEPAPLSASLSTVLPISCAGRTDGSINLVMSGGSAPFSYAWADGSTSAVRTGLSPGSYAVSVSDLVGCEFDTVFSIGNSPVLQVSLQNLLPESCPGLADGGADVAPLGGTPPYTYRWTNGLSTQDAVGLSADEYLLTVRDSRGCTATLPVTIPDGSPITVSALKVNPACNKSDGAIHLQVSGADGGLSYLWSDGQTSASATGLAAGAYDVIIMDGSCMVSRRYLLDNSSELSLITLPTETACNAATGTAEALVSGGSTPYAWLWSNGQTTQTATVLDAGWYEVAATDATGCVVHGQALIERADDLALSAVVVPPTFCGANSGVATVAAGGGAPPYNFLWSSGSGTSSASGLRSGLYSVRVSDINGCVDTLRVAVEDAALLLSINGSPAFCGAFSAGATSVLSGGSAPYRYRWSNGDTTAAISGLPAAVYTLVVRDNGGCLAVESIALQGSAGVLAEADVQGISCESLQDGAISVHVLEGVPAFEVSWTDGFIGADRMDLPPLVYTVAIQDQANCIASGPVAVGDGCDVPLDAVDDFVEAIEGLPTGVEVLLNDSYPDRDDIFVVLVSGASEGTVSPGGDGIFVYSALEGFTSLDSFAYALCNGFGLCDTAWVYVTVLPEFQIPDAFSPNGDGINDFFDIRGIDAYPDNNLVLINRWGSEVFRAEGYLGGWNGVTENGAELPIGTYFYRLELGPGLDVLSGYLVLHR
ncbi:MAG: T9SS type B sorting domain-containing protein [Bacteroidetes bacterium]|nr:T9SS type B sorting domain-containing protein [Bacteroidota bacterium]